MIACLPVSFKRHNSSSSSSSSSHNTSSTGASHSTTPTSPEPSPPVHRKLTKRRRHQSYPIPDRSRPPLEVSVSPPEASSFDLINNGASPLPPEQLSSPVSESVSDEILFPPPSNDNEQFRSARRRPPPPVWGDRVNGEDLINRWSRMDVSDDVLIAHLEALRRNTQAAHRRDTHRASQFETPEEEDDASSETQGLQDDDRRWKKARTTLFCCRELIRTELSYLDGLLQLENGETVTPPQNILICYLPALIASSIELSVNMLSDPTAYGVSKAFVEAEKQLENAFVPWCGIIGEVLTDEPTSECHHKLTRGAKTIPGGTRSHRRGHSSGGHGHLLRDHQSNDIPEGDESPSADNEPGFGMANGVIRLFKRLSLSSHNTLTTATSDPGPHGGESNSPVTAPSSQSTHSPSRSHSVQHHTSNSNSPQDSVHLHDAPAVPNTSTRRSHNDTQPRITRGSRHVRSSRRAGRVATVRELAIQPTQRVMRYVLLYRDLLDHTTDSSSRPCVESALESATRIASKCDRAQGNAAFLRVSD